MVKLKLPIKVQPSFKINFGDFKIVQPTIGILSFWSDFFGPIRFLIRANSLENCGNNNEKFRHKPMNNILTINEIGAHEHFQLLYVHENISTLHSLEFVPN